MKAKIRIKFYDLHCFNAPFSYEYIKDHAYGKWRIKDSHDSAIGSSEDEKGAQIAVEFLNYGVKNAT